MMNSNDSDVCVRRTDMLSSSIFVHHHLVSRRARLVPHIANWQCRFSRDTYHACKILELSLNFVFGARTVYCALYTPSSLAIMRLHPEKKTAGMTVGTEYKVQRMLQDFAHA